MHASDLTVLAVISNPVRYRSRTTLFHDFAAEMRQTGVHLVVVEAAFGDRPWKVTDSANPDHLQVRHFSEVWNKESLQNLGVQHLSRIRSGWKAVATIDADVSFLRPNWATETLEALQHWSVVQPWSDCYDLGPDGQHVAHHRSFARQYVRGEPIPAPDASYAFAHPGYAWAWTRDAYERLGGFLDTAAAGAGDHHMALGLIGRAEASMPGGISAGYRADVMQWQARAERHVVRNLGYVEGAIAHAHHGPKSRRGYQERWGILTSEDFDPRCDLKRNSYGVLELSGGKPGLRDKLRAYMRSRDEDSREM